MTTFISYFSKEYVISALASMQSAVKSNPGSNGMLVCIDQEGLALLNGLSISSNISIVPFEQLEKSKSEFERFLITRTKFEALVSIKPILLYEISQYISENQHYIYLDTDVYFFNPIDKFLLENKQSSFIVFQHMYQEQQQKYPFGKFNAGLVILKKNKFSNQILIEWAKLCSDWCFLRTEPGRYADQGYLDNLVNCESALGAQSTSINLGMHYLLTRQKLKRNDEKILINDEPLICFHFHGLRIGSNLIATGLNRYGFKFSNLYIFKVIYEPVVRQLKAGAQCIKEFKPEENFFFQETRLESEKGRIFTFIGNLKSSIIKTYLFYL